VSGLLEALAKISEEPLHPKPDGNLHPLVQTWLKVSEEVPGEDAIDLAEKHPVFAVLLEAAYAVVELRRNWPKDPKTGKLLPFEECSPGAAALHAAQEYTYWGNPNLFQKFVKEWLGLEIWQYWKDVSPSGKKTKAYGDDIWSGHEFTEAMLVHLTAVGKQPWQKNADWLTDPEACVKYLRKVAFRERKRIKRDRDGQRKTIEAKKRFREKKRAEFEELGKIPSGLDLSLHVRYVDGFHGTGADLYAHVEDDLGIGDLSDETINVWSYSGEVAAEQQPGIVTKNKKKQIKNFYTPLPDAGMRSTASKTVLPPQLPSGRGFASDTHPEFTAVRGVLKDIYRNDKNEAHRAMAEEVLTSWTPSEYILRDLSREFSKDVLQGFKRKVKRRLEKYWKNQEHKEERAQRREENFRKLYRKHPRK
jgi:hypothetical protein